MLQLPHRKVFDDPLFHVFQPVMILIQYGQRFLDVD